MRLLDLLLPVPCARCGEPPVSPCTNCLATLNESPILQIPEGLRSLTSLTAYDERSAKFITDAKYRNSRMGLMTLARWSARMLPDEVADEVGLVTWAPTTNQRRRERGFDQAQIIAGIVGRTLGVPTRRLLRRSTGAAQTGRTRIERLNGPVFLAVGGLAGGSRSVTRPRKSVLIVDDVCTTGATLSAAAGALARVGHGPLHGLVIARTPLPGT
jgi:predicted amidophosphoribosyltransferase